MANQDDAKSPSGPAPVPSPMMPEAASETSSNDAASTTRAIAGPSAPTSSGSASSPDNAAASPSAIAASCPVLSTSSSGKATSSDPATSSEPAAPERNYPKDARLLQYSPPRPALPPSRALPRFLKVLAAVIFVTGTTASICALLYQRYVLPKLMVTKARIVALHQHNLTNYDKLLGAIYAMLDGSGTLYSASRRRLESRKVKADPTLPVAAQADFAASKEGSEKNTYDRAEDVKTVDPSDEGHATGAQQQDQPAARLTDPLRTSLDKLSQTLTVYAPVVETAPSWDKLTKSEEPTPTQSLIKSLETLTNFLTNESFYASTPSYPSSAYGYNYGAAGSQMPTRSGTDKEKIQQLKGEIRSLKGALLTRKNFAPVKETS